MTVDLLIAVIAFVFGLVAMVMAIKKQRNAPALYSAAVDQTAELERKVATLERDVSSLQRMLVEKQNEIDQLRERIRQLERGIATEAAPTSDAKRSILLVGVGSDMILQEDLAQLRRVQAQTNLRLSRLLPVSKRSLERTLERHRAAGQSVRYLHLAVHSSPDGLLFEDGVASGIWLSEHLAGVEIAVLAGCSNDQVADFLTVVPAVVSMREDVNNRDAALFTGAFWFAVGQGLDANEAFERALQRAPATVGEFVELHL